jgi:hypothetical protein
MDDPFTFDSANAIKVVKYYHRLNTRIGDVLIPKGPPNIDSHLNATGVRYGHSVEKLGY